MLHVAVDVCSAKNSDSFVFLLFDPHAALGDTNNAVQLGNREMSDFTTTDLQTLPPHP